MALVEQARGRAVTDKVREIDMNRMLSNPVGCDHKFGLYSKRDGEYI